MNEELGKVFLGYFLFALGIINGVNAYDKESLLGKVLFWGISLVFIVGGSYLIAKRSVGE